MINGGGDRRLLLLKFWREGERGQRQNDLLFF